MLNFEFSKIYNVLFSSAGIKFSNKKPIIIEALKYLFNKTVLISSHNFPDTAQRNRVVFFSLERTDVVVYRDCPLLNSVINNFIHF